MFSWVIYPDNNLWIRYFQKFQILPVMKNDKFQKIAFFPVALEINLETWNFLWELL